MRHSVDGFFRFLSRKAVLATAVMGAIVLVALGVLLLSQRQRMHHDVLFALGTAAITIGAITCVLWLAVSIGQSAAWLLLCAAGVALASWRVHCRSEGD